MQGHNVNHGRANRALSHPQGGSRSPRARARTTQPPSCWRGVPEPRTPVCARAPSCGASQPRPGRRTGASNPPSRPSKLHKQCRAGRHRAQPVCNGKAPLLHQLDPTSSRTRCCREQQSAPRPTPQPQEVARIGSCVCRMRAYVACAAWQAHPGAPHTATAQGELSVTWDQIRWQARTHCTAAGASRRGTPAAVRNQLAVRKDTTQQREWAEYYNPGSCLCGRGSAGTPQQTHTHIHTPVHTHTSTHHTHLMSLSCRMRVAASHSTQPAIKCQDRNNSTGAAHTRHTRLVYESLPELAAVPLAGSTPGVLCCAEARSGMKCMQGVQANQVTQNSCVRACV